MAPGNFSNQWLEFWAALIFLVELPHIPQVLDGKAFDAGKFPLEIIGQSFHNGFAPAFIVLPPSNHPADIPVEPYQFFVDRLERLILSGPDAFFHFGE